MIKMFEKFNKKSNGVRMDGVITEGFKFKKLKDFKDQTIDVKGYMFAKSDYNEKGEQVLIITDDCIITMPTRALEQFKEIDNDEELRNAVKEGKLKIKVGGEYMTKYNNSTVTYDLVG